MKKVVLFAVMALCLSCLTSQAQENFQWDVIDSIPKTKDQIYSDTKMFIAEQWKSAQNVIQNDDKEKGIILLKGNSIQKRFFQLNDHIWVFVYTVKFYMKDNKYRIVIDNIYCESARCAQYDWPLLPITLDYPGMMKTSLNKERFIEIMVTIQAEMQLIVDKYKSFMQTESTIEEDW